MLPQKFTRNYITITIWLIVLIVTTTSRPTNSLSIRVSDTGTIYDVLESHGLPKGLLPKGVKDFSIKEDGNFVAHLDQTCTLKLDNQFEYKNDISGQLSYGRVANLTGIKSLELFVWVSVNGVRVDIPNSGRIHFDLEKGVHKELSLSLFETPSECVAHPPEGLDHQLAAVKKLDGVLEYRRFGQKTSRRDVI